MDEEVKHSGRPPEDIILDNTPEDDTPTERRVRVTRYKVRVTSALAMLATAAGMYFGKIDPYNGALMIIAQGYALWVGDGPPAQETLKRALLIGAIPMLTGLAGCGLHIVKYDPENAATLADGIRDGFQTYRQNAPTPTADVQILGDKLDENLGKQAELLRTK